ncbi:MAG: hypothetical protein M1816_003895 [Peltula sp. TS41687]|nr:MAG: hypothetical protein M1816_003895 [Peltula sp. TS41687]
MEIIRLMKMTMDSKKKIARLEIKVEKLEMDTPTKRPRARATLPKPDALRYTKTHYYPGVHIQYFRDKYLDGSREETLVPRPEYENSVALWLAAEKVFGTAHVYALFVDVGGVGGFDLQLAVSKIYPDLDFVVQDRAPGLRQAQKDIREQGVEFMEHDLFQQNPVKGGYVYWLRYIWTCINPEVKPSMHQTRLVRSHIASRYSQLSVFQTIRTFGRFANGFNHSRVGGTATKWCMV